MVDYAFQPHESRTLHPAPHALNPKLQTLHPTPYTLNPTPHTPHPKPHTLNPTPQTRVGHYLDPQTRKPLIVKLDEQLLEVPQKALCGGIPGAVLEPLVRSWSHFVGIYRQKLTRSMKT